MQIGNEEYKTIAVIDDKNNLLVCLNDENAIALTSFKVVAEKEEGLFGFVTMEDGTTKCFIRDGKTPLPQGTMTTEEFFKSRTKEETEVVEPEPVVEPTDEPIEAEIVEPAEEEKENNVDSVLKLLQKLPPEAIGKIVRHMTKNIQEAKEDDE